MCKRAPCRAHQLLEFFFKGSVLSHCLLVSRNISVVTEIFFLNQKNPRTQVNLYILDSGPVLLVLQQ